MLLLNMAAIHMTALTATNVLLDLSDFLAVLSEHSEEHLPEFQVAKEKISNEPLKRSS